MSIQKKSLLFTLKGGERGNEEKKLFALITGTYKRGPLLAGQTVTTSNEFNK